MQRRRGGGETRKKRESSLQRCQCRAGKTVSVRREGGTLGLML